MPYTYEFPRPSLAADIVLITREDRPRVLLIRRKRDPFAGAWALPGGFVDEGETLLAAAERELREETAVENVELEQLAAFGNPGRDPRGWTVSVVYIGRVSPAQTATADDDAADVAWHSLYDPPNPLAFDHAAILRVAMARLASVAP
jgi:8-oxo-dGTP diphosphatase